MNRPNSAPPDLLTWTRFVLVTLSIAPAVVGQFRLSSQTGRAWPWFLLGFLMALAASAWRREKPTGSRFGMIERLTIGRFLLFIPPIVLGVLAFYSVYTDSWGHRVPFLLWVGSIVLVLIPQWLVDRQSDESSGVEGGRSPILGPLNRRTVEMLAVGGILMAAFLFRSVELERFPLAYHNDEANCGLMGRQILEEWNSGSVDWFRTRDFFQFNTLGFLPSALFQGVFSPDLFAHRLANVVGAVLALGVLYFLIRDLLGRATGVMVLGLAAVGHFSIHWSRSGIHCGHTAFLAAICTWIFWRGIRTGKTKWFVLLGVCLPFCLVTYNSALVIPVWLGLVALLYWVFSNRFRKRYTVPLILSLLAGCITFAPLLGVYLRKPETFVSRSGSMVWTGDENSIRHMKSIHGADYLPAILRYNLKRTLLLFNQTEDTNLQYGYHCGGLLDDFTSSAFVVGLAVMLPRLHRFPHWAVLLYLLLNLLLGSMFTLDAPQYGRLAGLSFFMMIPPAMWGREVYLHLRMLAGKAGEWVGGCLLAALLVLVAAANFDLYFIQHDQKRGTPNEVYLHALCLDVRDGGPKNKTYVFEGPFPTDFQHRTHLFVAEGNPVQSFRNLDQISLGEPGEFESFTLILPLGREDLADEAARKFPMGEVERRSMKYRTPAEVYLVFKTPTR